MASAASSVRASSRPVTATAAPNRARRRAVALPMPRLPPVTTTVLPCHGSGAAAVHGDVLRGGGLRGPREGSAVDGPVGVEGHLDGLLQRGGPHPRREVMLLLSTTNGSSNWYCISRSSRTVGLATATARSSRGCS